MALRKDPPGSVPELQRMYLGKLVLTAHLREDGVMEVEHETELAEPLVAMTSAMSTPELRVAQRMRRDACKIAGTFFSYVQNPDERLDMEDVSDA